MHCIHNKSFLHPGAADMKIEEPNTTGFLQNTYFPSLDNVFTARLQDTWKNCDLWLWGIAVSNPNTVPYHKNRTYVYVHYGTPTGLQTLYIILQIF